jgi:hypothetical protein
LKGGYAHGKYNPGSLLGEIIKARVIIIYSNMPEQV